MTTIYRIQARDNFRKEPQLPELFTLLDVNHPAFLQETFSSRFTGKLHGDLATGFISIEKLKEWYNTPALMLYLWDNDYVVGIYEVPESDTCENKELMMFVINGEEDDYKEIPDICTDLEIQNMRNIKATQVDSGQYQRAEFLKGIK